MSVSACLCCEATSGSEDELAAAARPLLSAPPVRLSSAARPAAFVRSTVLKFDPLSVLCGAPLDRAARALGAEWLAGSGAPALRAQSAQTYESYQHEGDERYSDDIKQIEKDVATGRSDAASFRQETLRGYLLLQTPDEASQTVFRVVMTRVLKTFVKRCHRLGGYTQGQSALCRVLLAFMDESDAFWTMVAVVERVRRHDFYSPPPRSLNGFQVECKTLVRVVGRTFPSLAAHHASLSTALEILAPRYLLENFIGVVPLGVSLIALDLFFTAPGDAALFPLVCVLVDMARGLIDAVDDADVADDRGGSAWMAALTRAHEACTVDSVRAALRDERFWPSDADVQQYRADAARAQAREWETNDNMLRRLQRASAFDAQQLGVFRANFKTIAAASASGAGGVSLEQFCDILQRAAPHLDAEAAARAFRLYDQDESGSVDFQELVCCLSALSGNSADEKMRLCFDSYDTDASGALEAPEIAALSTALSRMMGLTADEAAKFHAKLRALDTDHDGFISYSEFVAGVESEPRILGLFTATGENVLASAGGAADVAHAHAHQQCAVC